MPWRHRVRNRQLFASQRPFIGREGPEIQGSKDEKERKPLHVCNGMEKDDGREENGQELSAGAESDLVFVNLNPESHLVVMMVDKVKAPNSLMQK